MIHTFILSEWFILTACLSIRACAHVPEAWNSSCQSLPRNPRWEGVSCIAITFLIAIAFKQYKKVQKKYKNTEKAGGAAAPSLSFISYES